ncbi:trans-sulfuration enzyme family protein [Cupriavidus basilensis]
MSHHRDTQLIHAGTPPFSQGHGPVNVPVVRTSTVRFENTDAYDDIRARHARGERVSSYGRQGMDTHRALEDAIAALEGGNRTFLAPSGLAAISLTFLALLSPGDHALVADSVYAPVRRLEQTLLRRLGIEVSYFSPSQHDVDALIRPNTRLLYLESPSSLLYEVLDLPRLSQIAHRHWGGGCRRLVPGRPVTCCVPLALGVDVSILASTKYISGHSEPDAGRGGWSGMKRWRTGLPWPIPTIASDWPSARTMPTLALARHPHAGGTAGAASCATRWRWRGSWKRMRRWGVGLLLRPCRQTPVMRSGGGISGANGLVSFALPGADAAAARKLVDSLRLFGLGASGAGMKALVQVAAPERLATHSYWRGTEPVICLHIGLEASEDLIADLEQGLELALRAALPQRRGGMSLAASTLRAVTRSRGHSVIRGEAVQKRSGTGTSPLRKSQCHRCAGFQ